MLTINLDDYFWYVGNNQFRICLFNGEDLSKIKTKLNRKDLKQNCVYLISREELMILEPDLRIINLDKKPTLKVLNGLFDKKVAKQLFDNVKNDSVFFADNEQFLFYKNTMIIWR